MEFNFTDALILYCIYINEKPGKETDLISIIAYADYIDHTIIPYNDFSGSLKKLIQAGMLVQSDKIISTTAIYKAYFTKKFKVEKRIYVQMIIEEIKQYLNASFKNMTTEKENLCFMSQQDYAVLIEVYKNRV